MSVNVPPTSTPTLIIVTLSKFKWRASARPKAKPFHLPGGDTHGIE
jgi:hypothetical protein